MFPPHGLLAGAPAPSSKLLLEWCAANDIEVSPALSIEQRRGGWGLVANEALELGAVCESSSSGSKLTSSVQAPQELYPLDPDILPIAATTRPASWHKPHYSRAQSGASP